MLRRLLPSVIALALLTLVAPTAAAEPDAMTRSAARRLAEEGDRLFEAGDFAGAVERFQHAHELVDAPTLGVRWARSLARLGRLVEASERYRKTASAPIDESSPRAFTEAVEQAANELEALRSRIPVLKIVRSEGLGTVSLDGRPLSDSHLGIDLPVNPGDRLITAPGAVPQTLHLGEGDQIEVALVAAPHDAPQSSQDEPGSAGIPAQRGVAYAAYGVGVVGLGFGIGFGLSAMSQDGDLSERCTDEGDCTFQGAQDDIDSLETAGTLSTVGFVVAGIGAALGTVLILSEPEPSDGNAVGLYVGALEGGVRGSF